MSNYTGVKCPVCSKKFVRDDDIVVCPLCGAPHHRGCYFEKNECAFTADHLSGKEWRPPTPETPFAKAADDTLSCPSCGAANLSGAIFCQICGKRMASGDSRQGVCPTPPEGPPQGGFPWGSAGMYNFQLDPKALIYGGLSPDEKIEDETVRDLAMYVGQNSVYYLPRFKSIDRESRTLSFNFAALLFGFLYYFYRKMYLIGVLLLVFFIIGAIPSFLQAREMLPQIIHKWNLGPEAYVNHVAVAHYQSLVNVTGTINFFIGLILSFCANRFYYSKALSDVKKIRMSRTEPIDEREYAGKLSSKGGVSKSAVVVSAAAIISGYFLAASVLLYMGGF